jgi:hypothetical protein
LLVLERMINGRRAYTFRLPPMFYMPSSCSLLPYLVRGEGLYGVGVRWKFCCMALLPLSHVYGWTAWSDGRQPNEVSMAPYGIIKKFPLQRTDISLIFLRRPILSSAHPRLYGAKLKPAGWKLILTLGDDSWLYKLLSQWLGVWWLLRSWMDPAGLQPLKSLLLLKLTDNMSSMFSLRGCRTELKLAFL